MTHQDILSQRARTDIKELLEVKVRQYNNPAFIEDDPIRIPHQFSKKEDIEIAGFLAASIAWGQRKSILASAHKLLKLMDYAPYEFILDVAPSDCRYLKTFYHRTFNGDDTVYFLQSLQHIYKNYGGLANVFLSGYANQQSIEQAIMHFRRVFFEKPCPNRTFKHVADINKGSSAKRLNMFLRWMVRDDKTGVDFGIWRFISPADLMVPLDVHTGTTARKLGLLFRKSNDWRAVQELTNTLKSMDSNDPVKYDFALFGLGLYEQFNKVP
jgi:uncharacterized protein (TIGR02757 family)